MVCQPLLLLLFLKIVVTARFEGRTELINIFRKAPRNYDLETESCCNGVITNESSFNYDCCGLSFMEKQSQICCSGTVYDVDDVNECCVITIYDKTEYACRPVMRDVTPYYEGIYYVNSFSHYMPMALPKSVYYCGNQSMNRNSKICCNFVIIDNPSGDLSDCCGTQAFNPDTHVCCMWSSADYSINFYSENSILIAKSNPGDKSCCNLASYNDFTHYCSHDGNISERPNDGKVVCKGYVMDPETHLCCHKPILKNWQYDKYCCGNRTYYWGEGTCCGEYIVGQENYTFHEGNVIKCCGDKGPFDEFTHTCCIAYAGPGGYELFDGNLQCCGRNGYNPMTHDCCGIIVVPKPELGQSGCCKYSVKLSDLTTEEFNANRL